jgi:hypothetical protein
MRTFVYSALLALGLAASASAAALTPVLITVDENGNGTIQFTPEPASPLLGVMQADPGPGGLASALTYNLQGPPSLVAGDVFMTDPGEDSTSDIIRFNPAGTGSADYEASLVFYSDNSAGVTALADTGFPTSFYTNTVTIPEVVSGGGSGAVYTPNSSQPGYVTGFLVTYDITSDTSAVPEPASISLIALAGGALLAGKRWIKRVNR